MIIENLSSHGCPIFNDSETSKKRQLVFQYLFIETIQSQLLPLVHNCSDLLYNDIPLGVIAELVGFKRVAVIEGGEIGYMDLACLKEIANIYNAKHRF